MGLKAVFFFLFSISLINSFSISQSNPFPSNIIFGETYNTTFTITTLGPSSTTFYLDMVGISTTDEINLTMDGAVCVYSTLWACIYNQSLSGVYQTSMHMATNPFLDPSINYSYLLYYEAVEDAPSTSSAASPSYYSSTGGASFAPRPQYKLSPPAPVKNDTPKPPPEQPKTTPPAPITQPSTTIQNNASHDDLNNTSNESITWPVYEIKEIELIEAEPKTDDSWLYLIVFGLVAVGGLVYLVYIIKKKNEAIE